MQNSQSDMQYGRLLCAYGPSSTESKGSPISAAQLRKMAVRAGQHYSIAVPNDVMGSNEQEGDLAAVLSGQVVIQDAGDAFTVHTTDAVAEHSWVAEIELPAGLIFCFIEEGELSFKLDTQDYHFQAVNNMAESNAPNNCFLLNLEKPARLKRNIVAGIKTKKLNITVSRTWVARHLLSDTYSNNNAAESLLPSLAHGEILRWRAEADLTQIATKLLKCSQQAGRQSEGPVLLTDNTPLVSLFLQGQAIQCLALALNDGLQLQCDYCNKPKLDELQQRFMMIVERYINNGGDSPATLTNAAFVNAQNTSVRCIADELGMSVSAVQRLAKQVLGDSLVNYIRSKKLAIARKSLEAGKLSIGEVAYQAGYKHASNFAIAFKKAFGLTPGALRGVHEITSRF